MHPLVWIGLLLGGLAFWRRKKLRSDSEKVKATAVGAKTAATEKIASVRGNKSAAPTLDDAAAAVDSIDVSDAASAVVEKVEEVAEENAAD